jgi:hypothetical protein
MLFKKCDEKVQEAFENLKKTNNIKKDLYNEEAEVILYWNKKLRKRFKVKATKEVI